MKVTINQKRLLDWHYEIEQAIDPTPSFQALCLKEKTDSFKAHNGERVKALIETLEALMRDNFEYEQGRVKFKPVDAILNMQGNPTAGQQSQPVMLPGKTIEEYQHKIDEIMALQIEITAFE